MPTGRALAWPMLGAFAAVVLAFLGAAFVSHRAANAIHGAADEIANDASPGIEHLAYLRNGLVDLEMDLLRDLEAVHNHAIPEVSSARQDLASIESDEQIYVGLPALVGERELWSKTADQLRKVRRLATDGIDALTRGDEVAARRIIVDVLPPLIERVSIGTYGSIRLNAGQAHDLAEKIDSDHARSNQLAYALGALATMLAALVAFLMVRAIGRYTVLQEQHTRMLRERADELELFAARVAHDVMSPLGAATMAIEVAQRHSHEPAQMKELLNRSLGSLGRVAGVVDGLFDFARAGARPDPGGFADVEDCVRGVLIDVRSAAARAGLTVRVDPFGPLYVATEPGVLTSLLSNLLNNAIKYAGPSPRGGISVRASIHAERVRFDIADHGPGLPPGLEATVFEPYVRGRRLDQQGLGLGLATVKRLSEAHGGACGVHSVAGAGCVFWFELPGGPKSADAGVVRPDAVELHRSTA